MFSQDEYLLMTSESIVGPFGSYIEADAYGEGLEAYCILRVVYNSEEQPDTSLNLQEADNG